MGIQLDEDAKKVTCKCFNLDGEYVCFREDFVGALSDKQEGDFCTKDSFTGALSKEGLEAMRPEYIANLKLFSNAVEEASTRYHERKLHDLDSWYGTMKEVLDEMHHEQTKPKKATKKKAKT